MIESGFAVRGRRANGVELQGRDVIEGLLVLLALAAFLMPIIAIVMAAAAGAHVKAVERRVELLIERLNELERRLAAALYAPLAPPRPADAVETKEETLAEIADAATPPPPTEAAPPRPAVAVKTPAPLPESQLPESAELERKREILHDVSYTSDARREAGVFATGDEDAEQKIPAEPKKRAGLEEQLGARLPVWLGSIALFLAVVFLVKYTFDAGLITPAIRVVMGIGFGVLLLGAGEFWRKRLARIAQGVTAAGVACIFASLLAAVRLYELIDQTTGFVALAATTALAVALSLRQGPFVALLGLLGGFLTPALIGATEPRPGPLFGYLLALELGLLFVVRRRRWWALAVLTLLGSLGWSALWLALNFEPAHSAWLGPFLLASAVAFVGASHPARSGASDTDAQMLSGMGVAGATAVMLMLGMLVARAEFDTLDWLFVGVLGAGALVLGRVDRRYAYLPIITAAISAALLVAWSVRGIGEAQVRFGWTAAGFALLYGGGGYAALWRTVQPARWAGLSVGATLAAVVISYWTVEDVLPAKLGWGGLCGLLAAVYALASVPVHRRRDTVAQHTYTLAVLLTGVTTLVSLAVAMELHDVPPWMAVAWALEVPALAFVASWLRVEQMRTLAGGLAVLATIWLVRPGTIGDALGPELLLNWALWGYGMPAAAFALAAWRFAKSGAERLSNALEAGATLFVLILVTLDIRHGFQGDAAWSIVPTLRESATYVVAWFVLGIGALVYGWRWQRKAAITAGPVLTAMGALGAVLLLCGFINPLWQHESVGTWRILNVLIYIYAAPAVLAFVTARVLLNQREAQAARLFGSVGLLLLFVLVSLEVRQFFQGEFLDGARPENAESYAYSAAWIGLGTLLLITGIATRGLVLRWSSLVVMLAAVAKVFLFDTAHLRDLYRVLSFFGLGVSLLLLAFLYQRFVFARPTGGGEASAAPGEDH